MFLSFYHLLVSCLGYFLGALRAQHTLFGTAATASDLSIIKACDAGHQIVAKGFGALIIRVLCLFPVFLNAQSDATLMLQPALTYHIQGEFDTVRLPALQWILEEGEQVLSYEKLLAGEQADAKVLDLKAGPRFPIKAHRGYWFKIRLTAAVKPDAFGLIFHRNGDCWPFEPTFKDVQTFSTGQNGKTLLGHSGSASPASERNYPKHLFPSMIRGNVEAGDTLDIWCRVTMAEPCNVQVDLELVREKIILSPPFMASTQVSEHIFLGASIALWLFAALLFMWSKKPVYLWFFIFQSTVLLNGVFAFHRNEIYNLLFRENPRGVIFFMLIANIFQVTALLQLGRVYVGTKLRFPKAHFLIGATILLYFLTLILGTISRFVLEAPDGIWFQIRAIFTALVYMLNILAVLLLLFTKDKLALFFCLGAAMPIISLTYRIYEMTLLETPRNSGFNLVSASGMVLAMAFALAYRFRLEIIEKETALKGKINAELEKTEQQLRMNLAAEEAQRLSELDRMKTNFFSNITHEFRTPLTLMIEPLRRVLPKIKDPEVLENVQLAEKNSRQLLGLVNQLLDMAKIESGQMGLDLRRGDIGATVRGVFERFLPLAEKRGIQLVLSKLPADLPEFDFDTGKVELILNNLISNALKFTPNGGKVRLTIDDLRFTIGDGGLASKVGENPTSDPSKVAKDTKPNIGNPEIRPLQGDKKSEIAIRVSDTGIGIPPDQLDKIFDRFYQVDSSHTRAGEGTGIGLALSKELAELMGGRILVESEVGKGSQFTFVVPTVGATLAVALDAVALDAIDPDMATPIKTAQNEGSTPTKTTFPPTSTRTVPSEAPIVLLVEDNVELRNFIKRSIGETWQVVEASDGEEGLKKALDLVPDLVVSDVMMPRKDGLTLLDELKANELTAHIPVVLLTAKSAIESKLKGLRHGADDYLTKPFSTEELLARMENLVENRRRLREIYGHPGINLSAAISGASGGTSAEFLSGPDREFLQKFMLVLEQHLADETLGVEDFAQKMFISRVQLHRKLKALTDRSATDFIRDYRLECAFTMLKNREGRVGEIALRVGFSNEKYFSTAFKEKYGVSPSQV